MVQAPYCETESAVQTKMLFCFYLRTNIIDTALGYPTKICTQGILTSIFLDGLMFIATDLLAFIGMLPPFFVLYLVSSSDYFRSKCFKVSCSWTDLWQMLRRSSKIMLLKLNSQIQDQNPSVYSVFSILRMIWSQKPFYDRRIPFKYVV